MGDVEKTDQVLHTMNHEVGRARGVCLRTWQELSGISWELSSTSWELSGMSCRGKPWDSGTRLETRVWDARPPRPPRRAPKRPRGRPRAALDEGPGRRGGRRGAPPGGPKRYSPMKESGFSGGEFLRRRAAPRVS